MRRTLALSLLFLSAPAVADNAFLAGYVSALLDERHPQLGLRVAEATPDGAVTLSGSACVDEPTRDRIGEALLRERGVSRVDWRLPCPDARLAPSVEPPENDRPARSEVVALPQRRIFRPLRADPREPQFSARYQRHHASGETFNAGDVSFGGYFPFAERDEGNTTYQVGLQGAVFALFDLDAPSNDLVNADYWIGIPYSVRQGRWSARVRIYHQSSHLGDEFLLRNPEIERVNLSYEELDGLVAYNWRGLRLYGGGGYVVHSEPDLDPWQLQYGIEYEHANILPDTRLILATNVDRSQTQDWHANRSYRAGLAFTRRGREIALVLEHYNGYSPNGQFYTFEIEYTGIGVILEL